MRKRMNIMKMLSVSTSQKIVLKRLKKKPARPRSSIGRSHNRELKQATFLSTRTSAGSKLRRFRWRMMASVVLV